MGVVARGAFVSVLVSILLALGSADAHAYDFSVSPNPPNEDQTTTFSVFPQPPTNSTVQWDLNGAGGFEKTGLTVTQTYPSPQELTVRMRVDEPGPGGVQTVTKPIVVNGAPAVDFGFLPADPLVGQEVSFTPLVTDPEGDAVELDWAFGDGDATTGSAASHAYDGPGTYAILLTVTDEHGAVRARTRSVTVSPDPGPTPEFEWSPAEPFAGDVAFFTATSTPSQGSITQVDWDFDGDGLFDDATGPQVPATFTSVGTHLVQMRVTQTNGLQAVAFADVTVLERPPPLAPPPPPPPAEPDAVVAPVLIPETVTPATRPVRMSPFPVVRIAGVVLPNGALVRILSVRAPRGAQVRIRCRGRGCPTGSVARTSATRLVRFRRFERRLRAGVTLEIFVRQAGTIGKYTRFLIRAGRPPARIDRCLIPGSSRPVRCG
jgi:PKD repeat protein